MGTVIRKGSGVKLFAASKASEAATPRRQKKDQSTEKQVTKVRCKVTNCSYSTPYAKDLIRHMRKHNGEKPFSCDVCQKAFSRQDKLKQHKRIHEGKKTFQCDQCDYSCFESYTMKRHTRVHTNEKPFKCQLCSFSAKNSVELTIHTRFHTGDSPYCCPVDGCGKAFKTPSDLQRHSRSLSHSDERPYACSKCDYRTGIKCNLVTHMKRHHPDPEPPPPSSVIIVNPACQDPPQPPVTSSPTSDSVTTPKRSFTKRFLKSSPPPPKPLPFDLKCKACPFQCDTIKAFKIHTTKKHRGINYPLIEEFEKQTKLSKRKSGKVKSFKFPKVFECTKCPSTFVSAESLRCHLKQHATPAPRPVPRFQLLSPNPEVAPDEETLSTPNEITGHLQTINRNYYQFPTILPAPFSLPETYANQPHE